MTTPDTDLPLIVKSEVKTFVVNMRCSKCMKGWLDSAECTCVEPPQFTHTCTHCGAETILPTSYPKTTYEHVK